MANSVNKFYVYCYLHPNKNGTYRYNNIVFDNEPFYIGKGSGQRAYNLSAHKPLINYLLELKSDPIIQILHNKLTECEALQIETDLIKCVGRLFTNDGPLLNKIDNSVHPYVYTEEVKKRMSLRMTGQGNTNSKEFDVMTIDGVSYKIDCLKSFCKNNNLVYTTVHSAIKQKRWHKGFFISPTHNVQYYTYDVQENRSLYEITDIDGNKKIVDNLPIFCEKMDFSIKQMRKCAKQNKIINGLMIKKISNNEMLQKGDKIWQIQ